jgi:hypothetical protein
MSELLNTVTAQEVTLVQYSHDWLELAIDTNTGDVFAPIEVVAKMAKVSEARVNKHIDGRSRVSPRMKLEMYDVMTPNGVQKIRLFDAIQLAKVIRKYDYELFLKMVYAGVNNYLHPMVGYGAELTLKRADELGYELTHDLRQLMEQHEKRQQLGLLMAIDALRGLRDHSLSGEDLGNSVKEQMELGYMTTEDLDAQIAHLSKKLNLPIA